MKYDQSKTKSQLISELNETRRSISKLEKAAMEYKRKEKVLMESEEKYSSVVENSNDGIVINQEGKIVYVNSAAKKILGFSYTHSFA